MSVIAIILIILGLILLALGLFFLFSYVIGFTTKDQTGFSQTGDKYTTVIDGETYYVSTMFVKDFDPSNTYTVSYKPKNKGNNRNAFILLNDKTNYWTIISISMVVVGTLMLIGGISTLILSNKKSPEEIAKAVTAYNYVKPPRYSQPSYSTPTYPQQSQYTPSPYTVSKQVYPTGY